MIDQPSPRRPPVDLTPPFSIANGRYSVIGEVGRGAHAIVFRARDEVEQRDVAIKFLRADVSERTITTRFQREIAITSSLAHPHIAPVFSSGEWENRLYFVSELAVGASLDVRLSHDRQLPVDDALQIAIDVAEALHYAHQQGVVHRDVKPENILLANNGALLADFGIARAVGFAVEQALVTSTGIAVGTLLYMSPEQICAERDIDGRSDQYSLGLVLYEMLTGVRPHESASVEGLRSLRLSGRQLAVRDHRPSVPEHVERAIMRALCPAPADRFVDCAHFASALRGEAIRAGAFHTTRTQPSPNRRRTKMLASIGLVVAAMWAVPELWSRASTTRSVATINDSDGALEIALVVPDSGADSPTRDVESRLRAELSLWDDVSVSTIGANSRAINAEDVRSATVAVLPLGADSVTVALRVAGLGAPSSSTWRFNAPTAVPAPMIRQIAMQLIAGEAASADSAPGVETLHEPNRVALSRFVNAWRALKHGSLDSAVILFRRAAEASPEFAAAHFRTAQTAAWINAANRAMWGVDVQRAVSHIGRLNREDSLSTRALDALAREDYPASCADYRKAALLKPSSFTAHFGLAECLRLDRAVIPDLASPTRFRFRSNHLDAIRSYTLALSVLPSPGLGHLFANVPRLAFASTLQVRPGVLLDSAGTRMQAFPSLSRDTVAFFPIDANAVGNSGSRSLPVTYMEAVRAGRKHYLDFARRWVSTSPKSFSAQIGYALALELNGFNSPESATASSLSVLDSALAVAQTTDDSARVSVARVRIQLRNEQFDRAAAEAQLAVRRYASVPARVAPLATLVGNDTALAYLEARVASTVTAGSVRLSPAIARRYGEVKSAAALGRCDGFGTSLERFDSDITNQFSSNERERARRIWTIPLARIGIQCLQTDFTKYAEPGVVNDEAVSRWMEGNARRSQDLLDSLSARRQGANGSAVAWDQQFTEAWLLTQMGDSALALRRLERSLEDLGSMSEYTLDFVNQTAGFRNSVLLAARLAKTSNESVNAEKWSRWAKHVGAR